MAHLFDTHQRIVPTWLAASRYLLDQPSYMGRNMLLEIANPIDLTEEDLDILRAISAALTRNTYGLTIETVAGTIFPQGLYTRHGREQLYSAYQQVIERAKKRGTWGTYFDRMTNRVSPEGDHVNPLDDLIEKLKRSAKPGQRVYQSVYELCASDPAVDLAQAEMGGELSTYEPIHDRRYLRGGPCLSHLSFKISERSNLDLTAMYRSHDYCARALGNLLGLSRLLRFVANESGLAAGTLSCLSTHAELEFSSWGGPASGKELLSSL